jgi:two-component system catabolic regulation response regulator CreB
LKPAILIVEDESAIADTIAYALKTEGFNPLHLTLGAQAIDCVRSQPFALVILDIGLPDLSGFEVCRQMKTFQDIPVLFLTARNDEVDKIVGLELGGDDYMTKPFSPRELVARVRAILRRSERHRTQPRSRFEHDVAARRIRFCGHLLELTRYEYLLLRTLLAQPDRIYTRAQLMEQVWSDAEESTDRTVDAHIKTVRAKLRAIDPENDPISTHRGVGYSLSLATGQEVT